MLWVEKKAVKVKGVVAREPDTQGRRPSGKEPKCSNPIAAIKSPENKGFKPAVRELSDAPDFYSGLKF